MAQTSSSFFDFGESLDAAIFDAFTKRMMTPISNYPAFKLGLIDTNGNVKKQPKTREEKRALSFLDRLSLMFKKYMVSRNFQIYNEYRMARLTPVFLQAMSRAMGLRFTQYYDQKYSWNLAALNEEKNLKLKRKKLQEEQNKRAQSEALKKKELENVLQEFFVEMEEEIEGE
jgi:hypothetical protein